MRTRSLTTRTSQTTFQKILLVIIHFLKQFEEFVFRHLFELLFRDDARGENGFVQPRLSCGGFRYVIRRIKKRFFCGPSFLFVFLRQFFLIHYAVFFFPRKLRVTELARERNPLPSPLDILRPNSLTCHRTPQLADKSPLPRQTNTLSPTRVPFPHQ